MTDRSAEEPAVDARRLTREFQRRRGTPVVALSEFTLQIRLGEVHGLLGPNGAGKTTFCKILSTVLLPTSGTAQVLGHDVVTRTRMVRQLVGIVLGGERGLYPRLTARENLRYWGVLYGVSGREIRRRVPELLDRVDLSARANDPVETFSRGMKQRLHLARGLLAEPKVMILDEPTIGMDPAAARRFRQTIAELRAEGRTVLITTHDMAEAEAVCDRVSLINHGRVVATEDPRTIGRWLTRYERVQAEEVPAEVIPQLRQLPGVAEVEEYAPGAVRVSTDAEGAVTEVLSLLVAAGVTKVSTSAPSLEEVYLDLVTGGPIGVT